MNLFRWLNPQRGWKPSQTETAIRRILPLFSLPHAELEPGLWCVTAERRHTYQVNLFLWEKDTAICCAASSELSIERDLIPRELALVLLEENHQSETGSYSLVPADGNRLVVLAQQIDPRFVSCTQIKSMCDVLINQMQQTLCKLYAKELIISSNAQNSAGYRSNK